MTSYYAVPVLRENRTLTYNPLDGRCALASTPHDASLQLGTMEPGDLFAVWALNRELGLSRAGYMCSLVAPLRIFVFFGDGVMFPLGIDPMLDAVMEVSGAGDD